MGKTIPTFRSARPRNPTGDKMKTFAMALVMGLSLIIATTVFSQNRLDLFTDAAGTQCELVDSGSALRNIYVFLNGTAPALSVEFAAPRPACWQGATWVGDVLPGPRFWVGNTQIDFIVSTYDPTVEVGQCRTPPVFICSMLFVATGASLPCCTVSVVAPIVHPSSFLPLNYIDCLFAEQPLAIGQSITINPNETCRCNLPLATESTTWGRVKSLYR
jgi:hypothetical protein